VSSTLVKKKKGIFISESFFSSTRHGNYQECNVFSSFLFEHCGSEVDISFSRTLYTNVHLRVTYVGKRRDTYTEFTR